MTIRGVTFNDAEDAGSKTPQLFRDDLDMRYGTVFNVKSYRAVGDGVADDKAAIQAAIDAAQVGGWDGGGVVYFPPGIYRLGSTLLVKESNITLQGASTGSTKLIITSAAATYSAITFTGYLNGVAATPTNNATFSWNFGVRDLWIEKTTPVANTTPAISLYCIQMARLHNVHIRGFGIGVLCSASFNVYGHQVHIQSNSAASVTPIYGWKFDSDYACFSSYLSHCTVSFGGENINPSNGTVIETYGYYHDGNHPSDWFLDHCEADVCTYGFCYVGTDADTFIDVFDVHFVECIADQCQVGFYIYNNLSPGDTGGQVDIDSCYWANRFTPVIPTTQMTGIGIVNSSGVTVRGFMGWSGKPDDPTHYQNNHGIHVTGNSRDISITGCNLKGNFVQGIYVDSAQFVTIFGNTLLQTVALSTTSYGITLVDAINVSIAGNTIRSLAGLSPTMNNGIYIGSTSSNITIGNNVVDTATVTTPLTVEFGGGVVAKNNIGITDTPTLEALGAKSAYVATNEGTSSTSYTNLATTTDQVTVTVGASGVVFVAISALLSNTSAGAITRVGVQVSGVNTISPTDDRAITIQHSNISYQLTAGTSFLYTGLSAGSTTFKMKYNTSSGTAHFLYRRINVIPL